MKHQSHGAQNADRVRHLVFLEMLRHRLPHEAYPVVARFLARGKPHATISKKHCPNKCGNQTSNAKQAMPNEQCQGAQGSLKNRAATMVARLISHPSPTSCHFQEAPGSPVPSVEVLEPVEQAVAVASPELLAALEVGEVVVVLVALLAPAAVLGALAAKAAPARQAKVLEEVPAVPEAAGAEEVAQ
jgi:hypothetical protein